MIANSEDTATLARTMGRLTIAVGLAATAGIILTATAAPVRLVGVTSEGDTVLIEATEPVAYSVSRPDALSLVVDMRNVSVSDARADVERQGRDCRRAAGTGVGVGWPRAGTRARRAREAVGVPRAQRPQHDPRRAERRRRRPSAVAPKPAATSRRDAGRLCPHRFPHRAPRRRQSPRPRRLRASRRAASPARSRRRSSSASSRARPSNATTVTLVGNGHLTPTGVTESKDRPRRLVLDFPNVTSEGADADSDRQSTRHEGARRPSTAISRS